jgi:hypothetical protein
MSDLGVASNGFTVRRDVLRQCGRTPATGGPGWLNGEAIMSDTNDNSKLDHRELTNTELDAVSGGQREPTYHPAKVTVPDLNLSQGIR